LPFGQTRHLGTYPREFRLPGEHLQTPGSLTDFRMQIIFF
jgi:hypothetical protein